MTLFIVPCDAAPTRSGTTWARAPRHTSATSRSNSRAVSRFAESLELFAIAASLGSTESLVCPVQLYLGSDLSAEELGTALGDGVKVHYEDVALARDGQGFTVSERLQAEALEVGDGVRDDLLGRATSGAPRETLARLRARP